VTDLIVETVKVSTLKTDKANARTHGPRNMDAIRTSLDQFGQREPLVVHKSTVIAGNGRLQAMLDLGWTEVAIHRVPDQWTVKEARAYALASNRTAELAAWDPAALLASLDGLPEDLRMAAGFDPDELADLSAYHAPPPSLDDLMNEVGGMSDEDGMVRIVFKVDPEVASMWNTVVKATGIEHRDAAAAAVITAAYRGVTGGE